MPKKKKEEPKTCLVENCSEPAFPGQKFCLAHGLTDSAVVTAQESFGQGDFLKAILSSAAALVLDKGAPMVQPAMMGAAMRFAQSQQPRRPPSPPSKPPHEVDPWQFLGLDRNRATEEDIKRVRKHFADYYHPDKGNAAVDPQLLQQVNAAADACLKDLKSRQ